MARQVSSEMSSRGSQAVTSSVSDDPVETSLHVFPVAVSSSITLEPAAMILYRPAGGSLAHLFVLWSLAAHALSDSVEATTMANRRDALTNRPSNPIR